MNVDCAPPSVPDLTTWIGRTETTRGCLSAEAAAMAHATLATPGTPCPTADEALPLLWHWYAFPPTAPMQDLGEDGHPRLGGFLPPVPYERRMWASGALRFHQPLHVGEPIEKRSRIANLVEKSGSAGGMVFVSVDHALHGTNGLAITERQEIVYLPIAPEFRPPAKRPGPSDNLLIDRKVAVSPPLLFRYSAITFNAHRIHYDLDYARTVEHYPGLVVHGPLQANLLMAEAVRLKGRTPTAFRFRGVHPMFHDSDLMLRGVAGEGDALDLCTVADPGHIGMTATASWEDLE